MAQTTPVVIDLYDLKAARPRIVMAHDVGQAQALDAILCERTTQNVQWGNKEVHGRGVWSEVLAEEVGEVARASLALSFGPGAEYGSDARLAALTNYRAEIVQVAAVALKILERLDAGRIPDATFIAPEEGK